MTNPKAEPLKDTRVDAVCCNAAKKIDGAFTYVELLPPSGKAVAEMSTMT